MPRSAEHLKQHRRFFPQQLSPVGEVGRMVLEVRADLQPLADDHRPELSHQLFSGIGRTAHRSALRSLQP